MLRKPKARGDGDQFLPPFLFGNGPVVLPIRSRPLYKETQIHPPIVSGGSPAKMERKGTAPPVGSIYDSVSYPASRLYSSQRSRNLSAAVTSTAPSLSTTVNGECRKSTFCFPRLDLVRTEPKLEDTWVTVFGFTPESSVRVLMQFEKYRRVEKYVMDKNNNRMYIQYHSRFQAKDALTKDWKFFEESMMIRVAPCADMSDTGSQKSVGPAIKRFTFCMQGFGVPRLTAHRSLQETPKRANTSQADQFGIQSTAVFIWVVALAISFAVCALLVDYELF